MRMGACVLAVPRADSGVSQRRVLEATGRGLRLDGAYWQAGWDSIAEELAARRQPAAMGNVIG